MKCIPGCRVHQRGQVLGLGLVVLIAAAAMLLLMFDSSQVVSTKSRLLNAADASAYSAGAWRARVFNYIAYSNRAIIAQEVAVAQAVTLVSWSRYFHTFSETIDDFAQLYPPARAITAAIEQAAEVSRNMASITAADEIRWRDAPGVGYKTLLQHSQRVLRSAAGTFGASAVANEVAKAADNRFFAFALPDNGAYQDFSRHYESDPDRQRLKRLVTDSLDDFTGGPRGEQQLLPLPASCLLLSPSPSDWFQRFEKRGGTVMTPDLERWEAADTASLHDSRRRLFGGCRSREIIPLGWGAAELTSQEPLYDVIGNPGDVELNRRAYNNAVDDFGSDSPASYAGTGIGRVFELNYESMRDTRYPSTRLAVLASVSASQIRSSVRLPAGSGSLSKRPRWPGGKLWAVAAAEVYFKRPPNGPRRVEYASLYNPYWQVRLVAPGTEDRDRADTYVPH